jgi:hypothetical protein
MGRSKKRKVKACDPFSPRRVTTHDKVNANQPVDESKVDRPSLRLKQLQKIQKKISMLENGRSRRQTGKKNSSAKNINTQQSQDNLSKSDKGNNSSIQGSTRQSSLKKRLQHEVNNFVVKHTTHTRNVHMERPQIKFEPMKSGESFLQFARRINQQTSRLLEETEITMEESKRKQKRRAYFEKKKQRKRQQRDKLTDDFSHLRDDIQFGEVAERPPTLTIFPQEKTMKKNQTKKRKRESKQSEGPPSKKTKSRQLLEKRMIELRRERAIQSYKEAKKIRREQENSQRHKISLSSTHL